MTFTVLRISFLRTNPNRLSPRAGADGISIACQASTVTGNVVTDATVRSSLSSSGSFAVHPPHFALSTQDGGIVIFGSPGTKVFGNTIQSVNRQLMGGINMVDWSPFSGSFLGTEVTGNTIIAQSNVRFFFPPSGVG